MRRAFTRSEFIERAKKVHGEQYGYVLVDYKNSHTKIQIVCPVHGMFTLQPNNHLAGTGCHECHLNYKSDFLGRATQIHGSKYDYALTEYTRFHSKVKVVCRKHGVFLQTPAKHLAGKGCPKCGGTAKSTTREFIHFAEQKHDNKYDYSLTSYRNNRTKVKILCPIHGSFLQTPNRHLHGDGCPRCNQSRGEVAIRKYLIANNIAHQEQARFDTCRNKNPLPFDFKTTIGKRLTLIEYHGEQHYRKVNFSRDSKKVNFKFKQTRLHDEIKRKWCEDNQIPLLVIPYWENIDIILSAFIEDNK